MRHRRATTSSTTCSDAVQPNRTHCAPGATSPRWHPAASGAELAFLDGPGGSQVPRAVIDAIAEFYATCNVNTHGNFPPSREVDRRMLEARAAVAAFLGASSGDMHLLRPEHDHPQLRVERSDRPHAHRGRRGAHHAARSRGESRPVARAARPRRRRAGGAPRGVRRARHRGHGGEDLAADQGVRAGRLLERPRAPSTTSPSRGACRARWERCW